MRVSEFVCMYWNLYACIGICMCVLEFVCMFVLMGHRRIVFDCAAKFQNMSLNGQLLLAPDYTNSLVGVLLRFQEERVAVMADVKMFLQVNVKQEDRESLRFLWWPEGDLSKEPV